METYAYLTAMKDGTMAFESNYDSGLVAALKAAIPYSERRWDRKQRLWFVAPQHAQILADLCARHLDVRVSVPRVRSIREHTTQLVKLLYLGAAKERAGGEITANGWADGEWSLFFPLSVLQEWFCVDSKPGQATTLYAILGVKRDATVGDLRTAHRRAARTWHPDVNTDPDAREQFQRIQRAYEVLRNSTQRKKYDAGLALAASVSKSRVTFGRGSNFASISGPANVWRPPLRCGWLLLEGVSSLGRFAVGKILQWEDIVNETGQTLVTFWPLIGDRHVEKWI